MTAAATRRPDLDEHTVSARVWLAENAPATSVAARDAHDVSVFHNLSHDVEQGLIDELRAWQRTKFDGGYAAISWPSDMYGAGLPAEFEDAFKQAEAELVPLPRHELLSVTVNLIAPTIRIFASETVRSMLLPGLLDGSLLACQLFSEPAAGSDLANVSTRARRDGDDWVLSGQKVWTSGAQFADWGQAIVRTEPGSSGSGGLTTFVIPMDAEGVEVRPIRQMSGGTSFNEVFLNDVRIPDSHRLGDIGDGWAVTRATLGFERANASNKKGVGGSFDQLLELAQRTGSLQHRDIRTGLAEVRLREVGAEVALRRDKRARDAGEAPGAAGSMRKLQWVTRLGMVSDLARTMLGDKLIADDGDPGTFSWNAHLLGAPGYRIAGGTDQIQRSIIAERHLGLPREPRAPKPSRTEPTK
ncbi:acyl-CoA dehydrogenase family protein [Gordonia terrae]|uniref:Acyl-CoA dehydrogenase n=2 Tax=Gordonia terrae TaxID=2055 RepID=A0AAD0NY26_9ACTN|nr:acyl-CoA dehydrogenase family protein [Gordonia terrae]VTR09169.1 acyl-CoA dehydrogenase AcdA [Clostridioides difficile]ANY21849.1 acyl-CoA dehydrogenase [Gordonia terrae]AWO82584.1 acyl-CoA dehydrogenase [Gordonia terrae]VTS22289.1 Acyl-CoA dehydrogenase fadE12 [Gordonia terrae]GAB44662.1 putative acyl-CoA dehydrogenase [Gordonia terrae NBRC 100016]